MIIESVAWELSWEILIQKLGRTSKESTSRDLSDAVFVMSLSLILLLHLYILVFMLVLLLFQIYYIC